MSEFYHVSRTGLEDISSLNLVNVEGAICAEGFFSNEEFRTHVSELFPSGLSPHGIRYLYEPFISMEYGLHWLQNSYIIENSFELIRRLKFPQRNSRFECYFACLTLEDAKIIREQTFGGEGLIYKVVCNNYFKADMSFLRQLASIIGYQVVAEKYWSGMSSSEPFWEILLYPPIQIMEKLE